MISAQRLLYVAKNCRRRFKELLYKNDGHARRNEAWALQYLAIAIALEILAAEAMQH